MRRFELHRDEDASGVSGVGIVAQGVEFDNGKCALIWLTSRSSVAIYESIIDLEAIHGHEGRTRVVFIDINQTDEAKGLVLEMGRPLRKIQTNIRKAPETPDELARKLGEARLGLSF